MSAAVKLLQIVPTFGLRCGLAVLAKALGEQLARAQIESTFAATLPHRHDAEVVLLWFHSDLLDPDDVRSLRAATDRPLALFVHSAGAESAMDAVDGVLSMSPGLVPEGAPSPHVFPHPATPQPLQDRSVLRRRFGLPTDVRVLGTCGFLRLERQFDEVAARLAPVADEAGWFIHIMSSPWYQESPGVLERLGQIQRRHPTSFGFECRHLDEAELILRMQACDLVWCWTSAPSSPYASGVVATQHASGTRLVAADKLQHELVLGRPNVVRAPATLGEFLTVLTSEAASARLERHDPSLISWERVLPGIADWLGRLALSPTRAGTG